MDLSRLLRPKQPKRPKLIILFVVVALAVLTGCGPAVPLTDRTADLPTTVAPALMPVTITSTPTITPTPLPTVPPTATLPPSATPTLPTPTEEATATTPPPTLTPTPAVTVNGMAADAFVVMDEEVQAHIRQIFATGQELGRNPNAFSKIGDSLVLTSSYLTRFDSGAYTLGPYEFLQPTIDHYAGSFARYGVAVKVGLHAWSVFDPFWANKEFCQPEETMLACEIRLHNPSVMLIRVGTNDTGSAESFEENVRRMIEECIAAGVIPVLGTKPDRFEGPGDRNNGIIRSLTAEYRVPLWDFDRIAGTLPERGLSDDNVHLTIYRSNDYTDPETFNRGYPVNDLTALLMLDAIRKTVQP